MEIFILECKLHYNTLLGVHIYNYNNTYMQTEKYIYNSLTLVTCNGGFKRAREYSYPPCSHREYKDCTRCTDTQSFVIFALYKVKQFIKVSPITPIHYLLLTKSICYV